MSRLIDADDFIARLDQVPMVQEAIKKAMDCMPTIEERKTGKWITQEFGSWAECSECHELYDIPIAQSNFCPKCGADMRGEEDDS